MNQHEKLIRLMLNEIQDTPQNESCILNVDNAGELTYYLDKRGDSDARIMLARQVNTFESQTFTINSNMSIQIGYLLVDTSIGSGSGGIINYGDKWHVKRVDSKYDIIMFVYNPDIVIDIKLIVRAFSNIDDCRLEHIEPNPIQTIVRHAMIPPKNINPDAPMRAYAFTYWTSIYPTIQ